MAKTPDTPEETTEPTAPEQAPAADAAEPAGPKASTKEQRAAKQQAAASSRPSRTPEERDAERRERRAAKALARRRRRRQEKARPRGERGTGTPPAERTRSNPQVRQGTVVSDKADKTITVRIDSARRHRRYEKIVRSTSTVHAHDEANEAHEGDVVRVVESRPLSATKRWRLEAVLERAK